MEIESLKKLTVSPNDVLLVEVDIGAMPAQHANQFMQDTVNMVKATIGPDVKVMVVPMYRMKVSVMNVQDVDFREAQTTNDAENTG